MKKLPFMLLFALLLGIGAPPRAAAQSHPRVSAKRAFAHTSETGKYKNNKARFRPHNPSGPLIDFDVNAHKLEKFKTARANRSSKFSKRH